MADRPDYVDTATTTEIPEGWISGEEPKLHQEFRAIGKTALAGCGFAPGISNVPALYACDQLDRVESIVIRVGRKAARAEEEVVSEWRPGWSPEILLEDYAEPPMLLMDGGFVQVPIFGNPETYTFPEPVPGEGPVVSHRPRSAGAGQEEMVRGGVAAWVWKGRIWVVGERAWGRFRQ